MKKTILAGVFILYLITNLFAQEPGSDDSLGFGGHRDPAIRELMDAPAVLPSSNIHNIVPNEQMCFDKIFQVKLTIGSRTAMQCMLLDTHNGIVGYTVPVREGEALDCVIKFNDPKFEFFIISMKGNIYHYENRIEHQAIARYVSHGNTQNNQYMGQNGSGPELVLHKGAVTRSYCDGKIQATAYRLPNNPATWFLFGANAPDSLIWKKYMGNFGIGYLYTDNGLYMIMEVQRSSTDAKLVYAEHAISCFDPSAYVLMEENFQQSMREDLDHQQRSLDREEQNIRNSNQCVAEKTALLNFKRAQIERQNRNLSNMNHGNIYQDSTTQNAYDGLMDPKMMLEQQQLETALKLCSAQRALTESQSQATRTENQSRVICIQEWNDKIALALQEMRRAEQEYQNDPKERKLRKAQIYFQLKPPPCLHDH